MSDETKHHRLARTLATWLEADDQRGLVRHLPGGLPLSLRLDRKESVEAQARAVVELLEAEGRIDDSLMTALVEHLPQRYDAITSLAQDLGLTAPPRPPGRARPLGVGVRLPVLALSAPIGKHLTPITNAQIAEAIAPDVPDGDVYMLDLGKAGVVDGSAGAWREVQRILDQKVTGFIDQRVGASLRGDVPVFAFGPIPTLAALGAALGNKAPVQIMQRYNWLSPTWGWHTEAPAGGGWQPPVSRRAGSGQARAVGLLLSVSGCADLDAAQRHLPADAPIWELRIERPLRDQIRTEGQLREFRRLYNELIDQIQQTHGREVTLHVFPAVPVAVAVAMGQTLIPKAMPALHVYDYRVTASEAGDTSPSWVYALTLAGPTLPERW